jgi:CheY-like chemotaxis protein
LNTRFPVLVVEDHARTSTLIQTLLQANGFRDIEHVPSAPEALKRLRMGDIRLVLSDYHMSPMDGLELLEQIRADDMLCDTPFILVTGDDELALMRAAARAGIELLIKPFKADQLRDCLVRAVGKQGFLQAVGSGRRPAQVTAHP